MLRLDFRLCYGRCKVTHTICLKITLFLRYELSKILINVQGVQQGLSTLASQNMSQYHVTSGILIFQFTVAEYLFTRLYRFCPAHVQLRQSLKRTFLKIFRAPPYSSLLFDTLPHKLSHLSILYLGSFFLPPSETTAIQAPLSTWKGPRQSTLVNVDSPCTFPFCQG